MNGIPSFRLERDVVEVEIDILREMGVEFRCGVEVGKDVTIDELRQDGFKGFYIAIGAQGGRSVGVPGEDAKGVLAGVKFMSNLDQGKDIHLTGAWLGVQLIMRLPHCHVIKSVGFLIVNVVFLG